MKILFVSRTFPKEGGSKKEALFWQHLKGLSELGNELLILTKYQNTLPDLDLPPQVKIQFPFDKFGAWEVPRILPALLSFRPDIVHILAPASKSWRLWLTLEAALPLAMRSLIPGLHQTSCLISAQESSKESWLKLAGPESLETHWFHLECHPTTSYQVQNLSSKTRVLIAGTRDDLPHLLERYRDFLHFLEKNEDVEIGLFLNRTDFSHSENRKLMREERVIGRRASCRLHFLRDHLFIDPEALHDIQTWDVALLAGLPTEQAMHWQSHLPLPLICSEEHTALKRDPRTLGTVTSVAWLEQGLAMSLDKLQIKNTWQKLHDGAYLKNQLKDQDDATNEISRLYVMLAERARAP